jgi:hypothetical protein
MIPVTSTRTFDDLDKELFKFEESVNLDDKFLEFIQAHRENILLFRFGEKLWEVFVLKGRPFV